MHKWVFIPATKRMKERKGHDGQPATVRWDEPLKVLKPLLLLLPESPPVRFTQKSKVALHVRIMRNLPSVEHRADKITVPAEPAAFFHVRFNLYTCRLPFRDQV